MGKVLIPLAQGLEEIEAITNIDVLRRAGIEVITVSIDSNLEVRGSHEIIIKAEDIIENVVIDEISAVLLPGGMPGAANLKNCDNLINLIERVNENDDLVAAICAAPMVLEEAGVLNKRKATSYPGFDKEMPSCNYRQEKVVVDGNIITGRGPGVALDFALTVVSYINGPECAEQLREKMIAG